MKYIVIILIIFGFLKSWNYGIYELKQNKNKTAAIAIFTLSIVRPSFSYNFFNFYVLIPYKLLNS